MSVQGLSQFEETFWVLSYILCKAGVMMMQVVSLSCHRATHTYMLMKTYSMIGVSTAVQEVIYMHFGV